MKDIIRSTHRLPKELHHKLERLAKESGTSYNTQVIRAVKYLITTLNNQNKLVS